MANSPRLTIISPSFNTGAFLRPTVDSILAQSFKDFEYLVMDGGSTDGTLETLKEYRKDPRVRVISEKGLGYWAAIDRGIAMARGEYLMNCAISDGYLDADWFRKCVEALDADPEISLVWGFPQYMDEDGKLLGVSYPQFHKSGAPQKEKFFDYWLAGGFWFPEGNFCMRKKVWERVLRDEPESPDLWLPISFSFNAQGYLPYFLPVVANYGRIHAGQGSDRDFLTDLGEGKLQAYFRKVREFRRKILRGEPHAYRDGDGNELPYRFSRWRFARSQLFSPRRFSEHLSQFLKNQTRRVLHFLNRRGMLPVWLKRIVMKQRKARFGA